MKLMNTSILKKISLPFVKMTIVNPQNVKNENNIDGNIYAGDKILVYIYNSR